MNKNAMCYKETMIRFYEVLSKEKIRIENEIVVRKAEKNEYGQFMDFEVTAFLQQFVSIRLIDNISKFHYKDFKNISDKAVNYIKESPYFFSLAYDLYPFSISIYRKICSKR